MAFSRCYRSRLAIASTSGCFSRVTSCFRLKGPATASIHSLVNHSREQSSDLFEYTTGRWIWNDTLNHPERERYFNVSEFKCLATSAVNRSVEDVVRFEKLGEGGFNRTFLITMNDGFHFLRKNGIPVPKIFSYSATSENSAGTEYIFTDLVRGTNLGDVWFDLSKKARMTVVTRLVELESRLFALKFLASGSLYYTKDLEVEINKVDVPTNDFPSNSGFCVGPDTRLNLWYGRRMRLDVDRGSFTESPAVLAAGARKETAYLEKLGRPLHPFQRLRREIYDYQRVSPSEHIQCLHKYLQVVPHVGCARLTPHIIPNGNASLTRPILRHPDLQPNNIFVADDLSITGVIDWQHSAVLPLFLQCGIPHSLQNYGDKISESLTHPELPHGFDELSERERFEQVVLLRRRQLHYTYVMETAKLNPLHYAALSHAFSTLRRKLFEHASSPWEGDNVTLKADLIELSQNWSSVISRTNDNACPITVSDHEVQECIRLNAAHVEADEQLQACRDVIGIGSEGWVPLGQYDEIRRRESTLKADALEAAESEEERRMLPVHWIFGDFDEGEYL
ncbi:hypothetical protein CC86DRAFT_348483 [Ophiobolus disseminans]|uniref:Uncharacterized protein n=1 Tax=Ophiobolus disseminans TaxID=1469910 RepID=A0A6A7A328_9PLEO|nr:hypothetical protein CC86DRAFT_348483 [Ophiobolus disseminans]